MPHALARTPTPAPPTEHEVPFARSFASPGTAPAQPAARPGHSFGRVAVSRPAHGQSAPQPVQPWLEEQRSEGSAQGLQPPGQGKPLPPAVQTKMEHAIGHDFSDVRVHEGPQAKSLDAHAYTRGTDLHFAPGRYRPATHEGQKILGHELAHVVQQKAGRVAVPKGPGRRLTRTPRSRQRRTRLRTGHSAGHREVQRLRGARYSTESESEPESVPGTPG